MPLQDSRFSDDAKIKAIVDDTWTRFRRRRFNFEREWYRNVLFTLGNQWIRWDEGERRWRRRRLDNWIPTPVTNYYASTGQRIVSVLSRIEPNWLFVPADDREQDMAAAEVCDRLAPVIAEENDLAWVREQVGWWLVYTGNCYLFSGAEALGRFRAAPAFPGRLPPHEADAVGGGAGSPGPAAARPDETQYRLYTDVLSPFEVYCDLSIPRLADQQRVLLVHRRDQDYLKALYGKVFKEEAPTDLGIQYLEAIGYLTSEVGVADYAYARDQKTPRTTVKRIMIQPSQDWPDGLYAVQAGDDVVEALPLPQSTEGRPYLNLVHVKFEPVGGAFFGKSPMNDLISKQTQINRLDSLIELITMRVASPIWLLPEGTVVHGWKTGEPGSILRYTLMGQNATPPNRIPGEQIPSSLLEWRASLKADFEEIGALFDALKGKEPFAGAPGVLVQQLIEQGMSRYGPTFRALAEGYRQWMKHQIELFRTYATTPRTLKILGENSRWKLETFTRADVTGAIDVRIEAESAVPRSEDVIAARTLAAVQAGLADLADPLIRLEVLKALRLGRLARTVDEEALSAVREHEALMANQAITVTPFLDHHAVHIIKHRLFGLSEEGRPFRGVLLQHLALHHMYQDAERTSAPPAPADAPNGNGRPPAASSASGGSAAAQVLAPVQMPGVGGAGVRGA